MKNFSLLLLFVALYFHAFNQAIIYNLATPYKQDFDSLANTGTSSILPAGWLLAESGTGANNTYVADNGSSNSGNTYSYGTTGDSERAFGTLISGSVTSTIGAYFYNNSGSTITAITINYVGEEWRLGVAGRADTLNFQYSVNATSLTAGTYINVDSLDFATPNTIAAVGPIDGNAAGNRSQKSYTITGLSIADGQSFYVRWQDVNVASNDDGLAIDAFTMTFNGAGLPPCIAPPAQPENLVFSNITTTAIAASFTAASPAADEYLTVISTAANITALPENGKTYSEGEAIGNGTVLNTGSAITFNASGLNPGTVYYFYVFAVSSSCNGEPAYNPDSPLTASVSTATPLACAAPSAPPAVINLTAANTSVNGSFTESADADGYLIIVSTNASISFTPVNGTSYSIGQTVGTTNTGKIIKYSPGSTFSTSGLAANTTYYFFVYSVSAFNCSGGPLYNATASTGSVTTTNNTSDEPAGYYTSATGKTCADLKTTLKTIISAGHQPKPYGDLWNQVQVSDIKPREVGPGTSPNVIWDIYSDNPDTTDPYNFTPGAISAGGQQDNGSSTTSEGQYYNREHSVPLSWFNGNTSSSGPATDYLHIFPTDKIVNSTRSNYIYGEVATVIYTTANGGKLGTSAVAGITDTVFEPINAYKGDIARAFLYFVTRYQDNMPNWTGGTQGSKAFDPTIYPSVDIPYLKVMLKWNTEDPVSQKEKDRNNAAYVYQGNRNPFIDHAEYADMVWNASCPGLSALPVDIIFFTGKLSVGKVLLDWTVENEMNFDRYEVERSVNGTTYSKIGEVKAGNLRNYKFTDDVNGQKGRRLYYRLKKVDKDGYFKYSEVFTLHIPLNTKFSVYPNPASTYIQLKMSGAVTGNLIVQVTDVTGKVLQQHIITSNQSNIRISTANLNNGTYLIKLLNNGEQYVHKVVVSK